MIRDLRHEKDEGKEKGYKKADFSKQYLVNKSGQ